MDGINQQCAIISSPLMVIIRCTCCTASFDCIVLTVFNHKTCTIQMDFWWTVSLNSSSSCVRSKNRIYFIFLLILKKINGLYSLLPKLQSENMSYFLKQFSRGCIFTDFQHSLWKRHALIVGDTRAKALANCLFHLRCMLYEKRLAHSDCYVTKNLRSSHTSELASNKKNHLHAWQPGMTFVNINKLLIKDILTDSTTANQALWHLSRSLPWPFFSC